MCFPFGGTCDILHTVYKIQENGRWKGEEPGMSKTASMVMKIIGASLAFAAVVCLLIGGWHDLSVGCCGMKKRLSKRFRSEYDDYADEELFS